MFPKFENCFKTTGYRRHHTAQEQPLPTTVSHNLRCRTPRAGLVEKLDPLVGSLRAQSRLTVGSEYTHLAAVIFLLFREHQGTHRHFEHEALHRGHTTDWKHEHCRRSPRAKASHTTKTGTHNQGNDAPPHESRRASSWHCPKRTTPLSSSLFLFLQWYVPAREVKLSQTPIFSHHTPQHPPQNDRWTMDTH